MNKSVKKVLIVEDETVLQDVFKIVLESGGYKVWIAGNGLRGLEMLKRHKPHLVLLDIFMPVMDGREFLRNIDFGDYPGMKVVVYSNLSDQQTENEIRELGAHDFVLKSSMTPGDLLALVNRHLKL